MRRLLLLLPLGVLLLSSCKGSTAPPSSHPIPQPDPTCLAAAGGGTRTTATPALEAALYDSWNESWLGSPAVADLDGDGTPEIVVGRSGRLLAFHASGEVVFSVDTDTVGSGGRIWAPPIVGELLDTSAGLEVAFATRDAIVALDASGNVLPGFPATWRDEIRAIAAGDVDGDGAMELVAVTTSRLESMGQRDILFAVDMDGTPLPGFPPNTTGASGCDDACYVTGGYDQNLALGDMDGDDVADLFAPHDNAYASLHHGTGVAFDANPIFTTATKFAGIRFLHDYDEAQMGYAPNEATANQAHFTNTAPAIVDIDQDGDNEIVMLGSVQNAAQTDRYRGVALWVVNQDGTRPAGWITPLHFPDYLSGLWDFDGTNIVGATNQVSVADLTPDSAGLEVVFAGFDGRIHAATADGQALWDYGYTGDSHVLTGGVVIADLSGDGSPEVIFASYSTGEDRSQLFVLDAGGNEQQVLPIPGRGAMAVPTVANVDADAALEIVLDMKDADATTGQVRIYEVAGSADNCLPWPTGRGDFLRDGSPTSL